MIIALVGRPNVGKSTLFNRLCRKTIAITHATPGVTRDCRTENIEFYGLNFTVMDTPGIFDHESDQRFVQDMQTHAIAAFDKVDIVFFMLDGRQGVTHVDADIAQILKKLNKKVVVLVNKVENDVHLAHVAEAYSFGFPDIFPISAQEGAGLSDVFIHLKTLDQSFNCDHDDVQESTAEETPKPLTLSIVGRPNVGKSTLFNMIVGKNVQLVHDFSGVTRDSVKLSFDYEGRDFYIVDTAGIRKKIKEADALEKISVSKSFQAIEQSDIVLMVIDALTIDDFLDKQDMTLIQKIVELKKCLIIILNKMDLVPVKKRPHLITTVQTILNNEFSGIKDPHVLLLSAQRRTSLEKIMADVLIIEKRFYKKFKTSELNRFLQKCLDHHKLSNVKMKYMFQIKSAPPMFFIQGNKTFDIPTSYTRYLINRFVDEFDMGGVPVTILYKNEKNPYDQDKGSKH
jgi:GTP-binding protein